MLGAECTTVGTGGCKGIEVYQEFSSSKNAKYAESPETFFITSSTAMQPQLTALQRALTQAVIPVVPQRRKHLYLKLTHQVFRSFLLLLQLLYRA